MISFALLYSLHVVLDLFFSCLFLVCSIFLLTLHLLDCQGTSLQWTTTRLFILLFFKAFFLLSLLLFAFTSFKCGWTFFSVSENHVRVVETGFWKVFRFVETQTAKTTFHHFKLSLLFFFCSLIFLFFFVFLPLLKSQGLISFHSLSLKVGFSSLLGLSFWNSIFLFFSFKSSKSISKSKLSIFLILSCSFHVLKSLDPILLIFEFGSFRCQSLILQCFLHFSFQFLNFSFFSLYFFSEFILLFSKGSFLFLLFFLYDSISFFLALIFVDFLVMKLMLFGFLVDLLFVGFEGAGCGSGVVELVDCFHNDLNMYLGNNIGS